MKISRALPRLFERAYPAVDPRTPMLSVLPLLRFHEIDAMPLSFDSQKKQRGIFGFSCLARILTLKPGGFQGFLQQPCEEVSEPVATVKADQPLSTLLDEFLRTRFGFARVTERKGAGALASLDDVLGLYDTGAIGCRKRSSEVSSSVFSLPGTASLRKALEEMFDRRIRRVFLSGTSKFVWDRSVVEYLFSPSALAKVAQSPSTDVLDIPISKIETTEAIESSPEAPLKEAAALLKAQRGQCIVFDGRVVTPWDVVMKPWADRSLRIRA